MKKIIVFLFIIIISPTAIAGLFKEKAKPELYLSASDPRDITAYNKNESINVFKKGSRIYFSIYTKKGFKSDYIKYQIIRQDDNAHIGGYSRIMNKTVRISDKNSYINYFVLNRSGKYFIQIFDIENLQQWIAMGAFAVLDE